MYIAIILNSHYVGLYLCPYITSYAVIDFYMLNYQAIWVQGTTLYSQLNLSETYFFTGKKPT